MLLCLKACELESLSVFFHPPGGAFSLFIFLISFFRIILMYFILNLLNIFRPARAAAAALIVLLRRWTYMAGARLRHYRGPMGPGIAGLRVIFCVA